MMQLIFYGYCGSNSEDAVAIDNIVVESSTITTPAPGTSKLFIRIIGNHNSEFI